MGDRSFPERQINGLNGPYFASGSTGRLPYKEPARGQATPAAPDARPCCLVLAESTSLRFLIRQILSLEGWDVTEQEEAPHPSYQAVVADLDCFLWPPDLISQAVQRAVTMAVPVLALTGQDLNPDEYAAIGRPRLLMKPFELASFLQVLQTWSYHPLIAGAER